MHGWYRSVPSELQKQAVKNPDTEDISYTVHRLHLLSAKIREGHHKDEYAQGHEQSFWTEGQTSEAISMITYN